MLGGGGAHRDRQAELNAHASTNGRGDLDGLSEEMDRAGHVQEGLVDRYPLDERREVAQHIDDGVAETLVLVEVTADERDVGAQLAGAPAGHARADTEGLCFVGRGQDYPAAHGDGPSPEAGGGQVVARRGRRVEIGGGGRPARPEGPRGGTRGT